jgi:non-ribosomal peptide synthetase component F
MTVIFNMGSTNIFHAISHLSPEDQILASHFGRSPAVVAPYSTVHEAFESVVDSHPLAVAARLGDNQITYGELDVAANRLANYLIEAGLRPRRRVCLVVQRSFEMLVGIFAILKAGCQYVPVDGGVSSEQALRHILKDTEARFVLCLPKFEDKIKTCSDTEIAMVVLGQGVEVFGSKERPNVPVSSEDGIYAIYTSGMFVLHVLVVPTNHFHRKHWKAQGR